MIPPFGNDRGNQGNPFFDNNRGNQGNFPPRNNSGNQGNNQQAVPLGPPPTRVPAKPAQGRNAQGGTTFSVEPWSIRNCIGKFTYVWMRNGDQFWFFPIQVGRKTVAGFRWSRFGWAYVGISLDRIDMFTCV